MSREIKNYPSDQEIRRVLKRLKRVKASRLLSPNATEVEKVKYELCKQMVIYLQDNGLSQRQLAKKLQVSESRMSEILHYHIGKISIDRLVELHEMLKHKLKITVA